MAQSLRRSQYITTYGPGAILEGQDGPRVIPSLALSRIFEGRRLRDFEITDGRLSESLLNGAGILRLPSNAELGLPEMNWIHDTFPFPSWALCISHNVLYRKTASDNRACPNCAPLSNQYDAWRTVRRHAIRFVRACSSGHLDDVDWIRLIPHAGHACNPSYLLWEGGGGALRHITIRCPICRQTINLGTAYARTWPCSGRYPELGRITPGCPVQANIIQRGAANLRIAELRTSLTIPPRDTALHRLLELDTISTVLFSLPFKTKQGLLDVLQRLVQNNRLKQAIVTDIGRYCDTDILAAINDVTSGGGERTLHELRLEEFEALQKGAAFGAPAQPAQTPGAPPQFEIISNQTRSITCAGGHVVRITPVNRLRVVMVQTGYRRLDLLNHVVDCAYHEEQRNWYPGVELFGEGIFLDIVSEGENGAGPFQLTGEAPSNWLAAWNDPNRFDQNLHPDEADWLHPVFVWWHTLAHRLINALSIDSGYSSAAVRERIFVDINRETRQASGGALLYTIQPGGDGTLGGLVALVPEFERVLRSALRNLHSCSNDPLCGEEQFSKGKYNGAACYACLLVSETSCEHRNMRLDRHLLQENRL
jgi:MrfA Zn-binding domain